MGEFLDDLESMRKWSDDSVGQCEYNAHTLAEFVWGETPNTARGREFLSVWNQCAEKRAKADDPRVAQLLAWITEKRATPPKGDPCPPRLCSADRRLCGLWPFIENTSRGLKMRRSALPALNGQKTADLKYGGLRYKKPS